MRAHVSKMLVIVAVLSVGSMCHAQSTGKVDLEVGAPVFASDGTQIGQVADVFINDEGRPERIRMTTGATLGFGVRTVEIPKGAFTALGGALVLDLPADAVQWLPELVERNNEK